MNVSSSASNSSEIAYVAPGGATESRHGPPSAARHDGLELNALVLVLEEVDQGVVLVFSSEFACYQNSAAKEMLADDAERERLDREMRTLSSQVLLQGKGYRSPESEVDTASGQYRMHAMLLGAVIRESPGRAVLVFIDRILARLPSAAMLMQRYWLTAREAEVALLLARGMRNTSIARALELSPNTVRHYTESVLLKFGVHSRAEVEHVILTLTRR